MAPTLVDKVYLPDLEPCLQGETVILSWRLVASALADTNGHRQSSQSVIDFLTNPHVQTFFTKPSTTFEADNASYKTSWDTRTSAVQITPTSNGKYDVKTIKDDSVWLSETARINLVAALRVVVVEYQSRPRSQLTGPISNQDIINLQEAAGATNAQTTNIFPGLNLSGMPDATDLQNQFDQEGERRKRIFQTYLAERRYFAMALDYIFTLMLQERLPTSPATDATTRIRESFLNSYGLTSKTPPSDIPTKTYHALVSQFFTLANDCVKSSEDLMSGAQEYESLKDEDLRYEWMRTFLVEAIHGMTVAFQLLDLSGQVLPPAELVQQWFEFVGVTSFFDSIGMFENLADLVAPIQCLLCVISLAMLNVPRVLQYFAEEIEIDSSTEYIGSSDALEQIHRVTLSAADRSIAAAIPVAFAWVPILHGMHTSYQRRVDYRDTIQTQKAVESYDSGTQMIPGAGRRNSAGSITTIDKTGYDDFLTNNQMERDVTPVSVLASAVTNDGLVYNIISAMSACLGSTEDAVFAASVGSRMRLVFSELLKATYSYVGYRSESVGALLSVLSGGHNYWNLFESSNLLAQHDVVAFTLRDQFIIANFLLQAVQRFPYEFIPFSSLCRIFLSANSSWEDTMHEFISALFQETPTLTFELPEHFNGYRLAFEEENTNSLVLEEDLPLFEVISNRKRLAMTPSNEEELFVIPAGTPGRFVIDAGRVVQMDWDHSALALLGKRLEVNLSPNAYEQTLGTLGPEEIAESISLLATLVRAERFKAARKTGNTGAYDAGVAVLAEASRTLSRTKDIISVVCDTLDVFIEDDPERSVLAVVTACLQFFDAILPLSPGRLWSYMARCTLLGNDSRGGRLSKLVGTLELSSEQFEFLTTSVRFFASLVDSAMSSSVQRKAVAKPSSRQRPQENIWLGISDKIVTQITASISQSAIDILESSSTWRFSSELQRSILIRDLLPIMNKFILYTFSMDDIVSKKILTAPLELASKYVVDSFLAPSAGSLRIQPLLVTLVLAVHAPGTTIYTNAQKVMCDRTNAVLDLATTLVRVANYFDELSTTIELQLFKATPFIARVCAVGDEFRHASISLLEALVVSAGKATGEPPSLLGYLGPQTSLAFLQILSVLDKPFDQAEEVHVIWRFFSTIIRNRQQWMANCLLTGKTPREARERHDNTKSPAPASSVLESATKRLTSISTIPTSEALSILDFVTSAQNYWPWTIFSLQKNQDFLASLREYVRQLKSSETTARSNILQACNEARTAAYIAETFAMQLFHLRQLGQAETLAKDLSQDLDYFLRDGVAVSGYNNSLHSNFARNFANQYPVCTLDNFARTLLEPRSLGVEYYYALNFADKMLSFDAGWIGPRNNGFKSEMEMANANLSLVDAQIALFHAWEFLLLELSNCLPQSDALKKQSLQVAQACLEANRMIQGHEQIFERLTGSRVDLALMLVQRVVDNTPSAGNVAQFLNTLWVSVSGIEEPYGRDNISIYRTLLKLVYVTLRAQGKASSQATSANQHAVHISTTSVSQTVLSILGDVVAKGFRTLVSMIHDSETSVFPEDIAILTAIMQACLCIPGISQSQTQIANMMATHDAVHVAVSLYSWSDKLADKGDPVYGELSLLFLLELSTLPQVAEQLASDGLLNHLTSASLAKYLNRPNVSPFADSVGPQRCYSIWTKAIVPLLLNILSAMGPTIATEVACVLNQFPGLMNSSVDRFDIPGGSRTQSRARGAYITLLCVSEIHSLALMTRVLAEFRVNNVRDIPEVDWDFGRMLENVEYWLESRNILRERLFPLGLREAEWKATPPSAAGKVKGCESLLEERIVYQLEAVQAVLCESSDA